MKEFEYNGKWWLPENPDDKIEGTLKFHPTEGATLDLFGSFNGLKDGKAKIILGFNYNNDSITLYKCLVTQEKGRTIKVSQPNYVDNAGLILTVEVVFVGHCFEKEEDILFDGILIYYTYLVEWLGGKISVKKGQADFRDVQKHEGYGVNFTSPEKIEAKINGLTISLDNYSTYSMNLIKKDTAVS